MIGRWLSGCSLDLSPDKVRSRYRGGSSASKQLQQCRRRARPAVPDRCTPSQQPARHAFETRERGEAAPADSARHRVRPASPEQRVQDDGVDRGLINLFMQAISSGEFIRLDPNDQDPINVTGGECSQLSVPRQTAFPVRSSNVRESEGWRISVRARPKRA